VLRFELPPRDALSPNSEVDPHRYYYAPLVGRLFRARIDLGLSLLDGVRAERMLELGYGSGVLLPTLARVAGVVDGIDVASEPADVRERIAALGVTNLGYLARGSCTRLPFGAARYDVAVAFSLLEHLDGAALRATTAEVARVLRPGGRFLVGCPAVHRGMDLAFAAVGFRRIGDHHRSTIHDALAACTPHFSVEKRATLPRLLPLGWAPYAAVLLRRLAPPTARGSA
jgi:SAM-dependent methyltransferase